MERAVLEKVQGDELRSKPTRETGARKGKKPGTKVLPQWKALMMATKREREAGFTVLGLWDLHSSFDI